MLFQVGLRSSKDEHSAYVTAAGLGCMDMVQLLLEVGVPINTPSAGGWTALHAAADAGHATITAMLLAHKVYIMHINGRHFRFLKCFPDFNKNVFAYKCRIF